MITNVEELNQEQRIWFAELIIATILSDDEVRLAELDRVREITSYIDSPEEKKRLFKLLESEEKPELKAPEKLDKNQLSVIFVELIHLVIADKVFDDGESRLLTEIAELFDFTENYFKELMKYCSEGLAWKQAQDSLLGAEDEEVEIDMDEPIVPLFQMSEAQKLWYASILTGAFMLDEEPDQYAWDRVKLAIGSLQDKKAQSLLKLHIKQNQKPPLKLPPRMEHDLLTRMFMELLQLLSHKGEISYSAQGYIKKICDVSKISSLVFNQMMDWCNLGVIWHQGKKALIEKAKTNMGDELVPRKGVLEVHDSNNSVMIRKVTCHVCRDATVIDAYILRPRTHKTDTNIFGIARYVEAFEKNDYCNYNLLRPIICPSCHFTSISREHFQRGEDDTPDLMTKAFMNRWRDDYKNQKLVYPVPAEIITVNRSLETVKQSYKIAVQACNLLGSAKPDHPLKGQALSLQMILAEVLMEEGKTDDAVAILRVVVEEAQKIFDVAFDNKMVFRLGRLIMLLALFFNDKMLAGKYLDFFSRFKDEKAMELEPVDRMEFQKAYGECKHAFDNREQYIQAELDGFHIKRFQKLPQEEEDPTADLETE